VIPAGLAHPRHHEWRTRLFNRHIVNSRYANQCPKRKLDKTESPAGNLLNNHPRRRSTRPFRRRNDDAAASWRSPSSKEGMAPPGTRHTTWRWSSTASAARTTPGAPSQSRADDAETRAPSELGSITRRARLLSFARQKPSRRRSTQGCGSTISPPTDDHCIRHSQSVVAFHAGGLVVSC
jgi:hypothetical protein